MWELLIKYRQALLSGFGVTFLMCALVWTVGLIAGCSLGAAGARFPKLIGLPMRVLSFILAGSPVLIILFWLHYPAQTLLRITVDGFWTATFTLALVMTISVGDVVRSAMIQFPKEYVTAGLVCGLTRTQIFRFIQLPLLFRQLLPTLLSFVVAALQSTLFASMISVNEVFRVAQRINAEEYRPVEVYSLVAIVFLAICLPLHGLALIFQRKYSKDISER